MESLHYFLLCSKTTITVDASEKFLDMNQKNALTPYIKSNLLTFDLYPNFKSVKLTPVSYTHLTLPTILLV